MNFLKFNRSVEVNKLCKQTYGIVNLRFLNLQDNSKNHYDLIVAGGGMIGTTLACTLGKNSKLSNRRILLLEGSKKKEFALNEKYSNRVFSINPGTVKLLSSINAWEHILKMRCAPVYKLQVWDGISNAMITFDNDNLSEAVAYIVESDVLLNAVGTEIKSASNVDVLYEAKIKDTHLPEYHEKMVKITLENGTTYTCNLLFRTNLTVHTKGSGIPVSPPKDCLLHCIGNTVFA